MNMKRRGFLKTIGATVIGGLGLGTTKSLTKPIELKKVPGSGVYMERCRFDLQAGERLNVGDAVVVKQDGRVYDAYNYHVQIHVSEVEGFIASLNRSRPQIESILRGNIA